MKVRWTEESVRLRITPSELAELRAGRGIGARLSLPGGGWEVALRPAGDIAARVEAGLLVVDVGAADVARLAEPSVEGVYGRSGPVRVLIEKDFPCAHPHNAEAAEPETERFEPSPAFVARRLS